MSTIKTLFALLFAFISWKYYINNFPKTVDPSQVGGYYHPSFEKVLKVFRKNIETGLERGAAFSVYHNGEVLVDLHGGWADVAADRPWKEDTVTLSYSAVKGVSAMVVAKLVDMGLLDYKKEVYKYWPDFASEGKKNVTVEMLMSHQAGLILVDEAFSLYDIRDRWEKVERMIAKSKPQWPPGTAIGYHGITLGMFADVLVRRVDPKHRNISQFFQDEIAKPFDIEFFIGLPKELYHRYARSHTASFWEFRFDILDMLPNLYIFTSPYISLAKILKNQMNEFDNPDLLAIGHPSAMGVSSARGLAKLYDYLANGGSIKGKKLFSPAVAKALLTSVTDDLPSVFAFVYPLSPGLLLRRSKWGHDIAGCPGYGVQSAFADTTSGLGVAYITNHLGLHFIDDPREVSLLEAFYECFDKYKAQK